ncbi:divalent cation transporter [Rhizoctonia solani AG-3 Rhs1AP]|uniref:Divalent cation transporter n=1 Tax=Rhizoctonia solani AG-3 Rhs1AP TaxID=1086054 RepID=X8JQP9_9AGAM|nr:divalent cation transporter [Rhizoctonia solani AG-3 Rhs1AP]
MAPLETHELTSLAPTNDNGFYENHDARISKVSIHASDDEGSDDGHEGESASAALLGGHARSSSGVPDPPVEARQTAPTLFLTVLGMMFTGALLQRVTHWKPMRAVDELFILIPMLNNLKGNLELVLSARLATASHIGVLDRRSSRRALIAGSLSLLQVQALCVSALAATVSFLLGLALPDTAVAGGSTGEKVVGDGKGTRRWHIVNVVRELVKQAPHKAPKIKDGGTQSGWREFVIVLATAMTSACLSGLILGSFMCSIVILCRKFKLNPDNIAPPIASCLGDLVTLTLTALTSTLFFYTSGRHFPFLPFLSTVGLFVLIPFVFQLCRHLTFSRPLIRDGWSPLVVAMAIESGTGLVLDWYVGRYRGFGMLAVVMTSLPGSVGAVFVSRLSTELHQSENNLRSKSPDGENPKLVSFTLFAVGFPVLLSYLLFVWGAGWLPLPIGFVGLFVAIFGITVIVALALAYYLTHLFWRYGFDPDAYCLPVHSAIVDLIGQLFLVACYELANIFGNDVKIRTT